MLLLILQGVEVWNSGVALFLLGIHGDCLVALSQFDSSLFKIRG